MVENTESKAIVKAMNNSDVFFQNGGSHINRKSFMRPCIKNSLRLSSVENTGDKHVGV